MAEVIAANHERPVAKASDGKTYMLPNGRVVVARAAVFAANLKATLK